MSKQRLITILGPTASGKSDLGIYLAGKMGSSIISGDAFQVYKGMDIGTAKVMPEEMKGVTHYLVDCLEPGEPYSAAIFAKMAGNIYRKKTRKERYHFW